MRSLFAPLLLLTSCTTPSDPALRLVVHQLYPPDDPSQSGCYVECADTGPAPSNIGSEDTDTDSSANEWSTKLNLPLCNDERTCAPITGVSRLNIFAQLMNVAFQAVERPDPPTVVALLDSAEFDSAPTLNRLPLVDDENPYYQGVYRLPSATGGQLVLRGTIGALEATTDEISVSQPRITVNGACPGGRDCAAGVGAVSFEFISTDPSITKLQVVQRRNAEAFASQELDLTRAGTTARADIRLPVPELDGNWEVEAWADGLPGSGSRSLVVEYGLPMTVDILDASGDSDAVLRARQEPQERCRELTVLVTAGTPTASGRVELEVSHGVLDGRSGKVLGRLSATPEASDDSSDTDSPQAELATSEHIWTLPSTALPPSVSVTVRDPQGEVDGATTNLLLEPVLPSSTPQGHLAASQDSFSIGPEGSPEGKLFGQFYPPTGAMLTNGLPVHLVVQADEGTSDNLPCVPTPAAAIQCDSSNQDNDVSGGGCALTGPTAALDASGRFEVPIPSICFAGEVTISAYTRHLVGAVDDDRCLGSRTVLAPMRATTELKLHFRTE